MVVFLSMSCIIFGNKKPVKCLKVAEKQIKTEGITPCELIQDIPKIY